MRVNITLAILLVFSASAASAQSHRGSGISGDALGERVSVEFIRRHWGPPDSVRLVAAVLWHGNSDWAINYGPEEDARGRAAMDSAQRIARQHGAQAGGTITARANAWVEYDDRAGTISVLQRTYAVPPPDSVLVLLVDRVDHIGGEPLVTSIVVACPSEPDASKTPGADLISSLRSVTDHWRTCLFSSMIRTPIWLLGMVSPVLLAQQPAPRFLYIYRDSLRSGVDSAYRAIENEGAQICADLRCPNPYIGLESLEGAHEAWWINMFASEADTTRVANVYATDSALSRALGGIAHRKATLIGTPVQGFAVYRPDLSRGPAWSIAGARFVVATVTRAPRPTPGSVWVTPDSTRYILRTFRTRRDAEAAARANGGRLFALRPNWSMPAAEWVQADREFWQAAPVRRRRP